MVLHLLAGRSGSKRLNSCSGANLGAGGRQARRPRLAGDARRQLVGSRRPCTGAAVSEGLNSHPEPRASGISAPPKRQREVLEVAPLRAWQGGSLVLCRGFPRPWPFCTLSTPLECFPCNLASSCTPIPALKPAAHPSTSVPHWSRPCLRAQRLHRCVQVCYTRRDGLLWGRGLCSSARLPRRGPPGIDNACRPRLASLQLTQTPLTLRTAGRSRRAFLAVTA